MLLREMAFGLLNASVQASVSAYRFSSLPHAVRPPCRQQVISEIRRIIGEALAWHDHIWCLAPTAICWACLCCIGRPLGCHSSALLGICSVHRHERRQYADSGLLCSSLVCRARQMSLQQTAMRMTLTLRQAGSFGSVPCQLSTCVNSDVELEGMQDCASTPSGCHM